MSDSGSSWWLGADRLWRKGHPPSGWHQTRDGLWHPPPTAAPRLTAETAVTGAARTGTTASGSTVTITPDAETWPVAYDDELDPAGSGTGTGSAAATETGSYEGFDADADTDVDPEGDLDPEGDDDLDGYETAYYEQAGSFGRDAVHAADDGEELDAQGRARHMAGGGTSELWANLVDRVLAWPIWLQLALPIAAMVILLGGIGYALADSGGGQPDRAANDHDDVSDEFASGGPPTTSSSFLPSGSDGTGPSTSSSTTAPGDVSTTVTTGDAADGDQPDGQGNPAAPPPSSNPTSPSSTAPRPTSTTMPTTAPQDPYRFCEGLERLFPTDPDGDGTYCE